MIRIYLRRDLDLSLMRFSEVVSLPQIKDVVTYTMIRGPEPPFTALALIDTRGATKYDASFIGGLGFADWLRGIFEPAGYVLRIIILADEGWKYGMAHMFTMAANALTSLEVELCGSEAEMLARTGWPEHALAELFRPEHFHYESDPAL